MASEAESAAMRYAIVLSAQGLGTTSPNPPVGCVILDSHQNVVGTGFHRRKGGPHAEVHALAAAGPAARGGTAVVTLEPCNHVGVTPACRQELLDAGIARVVIGVLDPTSRGQGGAALLAEAGVDVEAGALPDEVLTVLRPWLTATTRRKPHVTWTYTASGDQPQPVDARALSTMRSNVDLVVSGDDIEEGVPGGHSVRHFKLADVPGFKDDPDGWLSVTFDAGVRSILLAGPGRLAADLQVIDAIADLVVTVPLTDEKHLAAMMQTSLSRFEIIKIGRENGDLLTHLRQIPVSGSDQQ